MNECNGVETRGKLEGKERKEGRKLGS